LLTGLIRAYSPVSRGYDEEYKLGIASLNSHLVPKLNYIEIEMNILIFGGKDGLSLMVATIP